MECKRRDHPGVTPLGTALPLGSLWARLPVVGAAIAMTIRTVLEDRTLQAGLPGYREYAQDVRYRLVPGIW